MGELIPQEVVAELLGVEVRTLRQWRTSDFEGTRKYLPAIRETATSKSYYEPAELLKFLERNEEYRDRVLAAFAPEGAQSVLLPRAAAVQVAKDLRCDGTNPDALQPMFSVPISASAWDNHFQQGESS